MTQLSTRATELRYLESSGNIAIELELAQRCIHWFHTLAECMNQI